MNKIEKHWHSLPENQTKMHLKAYSQYLKIHFDAFFFLRDRGLIMLPRLDSNSWAQEILLGSWDYRHISPFPADAILCIGF